MFVQGEYRSFLPIFGPHFATEKPLQGFQIVISIAEKVVYYVKFFSQHLQAFVSLQIRVKIKKLSQKVQFLLRKSGTYPNSN